MPHNVNIETLENCFRSYIWKPPEGFSDAECLELVGALDTANKATTQFLRGEIDEETFLDIKEWAHGLEEMDDFIESAEDNIELLLPGLL
ncbi:MULTISPECIES: hypothetical protein [unclassified Microcoleus]|uniref:hypothetical protein n=1 Tax=unclassified Microcoleus TaxID=2642155 RepID=UPI002FD256EA